LDASGYGADEFDIVDRYTIREGNGWKVLECEDRL
jgi:hypothetical protein